MKVVVLLLLVTGCGQVLDLTVPDLAAKSVSPRVKDIDRHDFERMDENHDGRLSEEEFTTGVFALTYQRKPHFWERKNVRELFSLPFEALDRNRNGFIEEREYGL